VCNALNEKCVGNLCSANGEAEKAREWEKERGERKIGKGSGKTTKASC
jgi:translation elongation factor EF-Ts